MAADVRDFLVAELGTELLPFRTFYGDGEPVDAADVELINEVYESVTVREPWQRGDLVIVDNLRMAHSREPYKGEIEIFTALANPMSMQDVAEPAVEQSAGVR